MRWASFFILSSVPLGFGEHVSGGGQTLLDCCCQHASLLTGVAGCAKESATLGRDSSALLVLKAMGPTETPPATCTAALWAAQSGYGFVTLQADVVTEGTTSELLHQTSLDIRLVEGIEHWLRSSMQRAEAQWLVALGEHTVPLVTGSNCVSTVFEQYVRSKAGKDLHIILAHAPHVPRLSTSAGIGFWLVRRDEWSARFIRALLRTLLVTHIGSVASALSEPIAEVVKAVAKASARLPKRVRLLAPSELACMSDGVAPVLPGASSVLMLDRYPPLVREAATFAALELACLKTHNEPAGGRVAATDRAQLMADDGDNGRAVYDALVNAYYSWVDTHAAQGSDAVSLIRMLASRGRQVEAVAVARTAIGNLAQTSDATELLSRASMHATLGDHIAALNDCRRASLIEVKRAAAVACMADALHSHGRSTEAIHLFGVSLALAKEIGDREGIGAALAGLASAHVAMGRLEEAERLGMRALHLRHNLLGGEHLDLAGPLATLADVWRRQDKSGNSLRALEKALRIQRAVLPSGHPEIGTSLNNIGYLLMEQGRHRESRSILRKLWW